MARSSPLRANLRALRGCRLNRLWLVLPAALGLGAAAALAFGLGAGLIAGRYVMRPLAFSSANAVVVASLGSLLVLMETARLASDTRSLWLPPFLHDVVVFWPNPAFPVALTVVQLVNTALMMALVAGGHWLLTRSYAGRYWRAVSRTARPPRFAASIRERSISPPMAWRR